MDYLYKLDNILGNLWELFGLERLINWIGNKFINCCNWLIGVIILFFLFIYYYQFLTNQDLDYDRLVLLLLGTFLFFLK